MVVSTTSEKAEKEWIPITVFKYAALFAVPTGLWMIFVGSTSLIQTNFRVLFEFKSNMSYSYKYVLTNSSGKTVKVYRIVWYAPPVWVKNRKTARTERCEHRNCEITFNKSDIRKSDLVLFHHNNMNIQPPYKNESQKWVFVSLESPANTVRYYMEKRWMKKFDWTMTYRTDSEGFASYGTIIPNKLIKKHNYSSIYSRKTKEVAWVVSHCGAVSKRDEYVAEMRKTINVDIFGRCGKPCPADCFKHISENYKFYLSFENSICKDYVTEKFFRIFNEDFDLIPVVRGAPNVKQLLPNITLISTSDYVSPAKLAQALKDIGSNRAKYLAMLKSKHAYVNTLGIYENGMCSLCEKLNRKFKRRKKLDLMNAMSRSQCFVPKL